MTSKQGFTPGGTASPNTNSLFYMNSYMDSFDLVFADAFVFVFVVCVVVFIFSPAAVVVVLVVVVSHRPRRSRGYCRYARGCG